jgi:hypothetical protein
LKLGKVLHVHVCHQILEFDVQITCSMLLCF